MTDIEKLRKTATQLRVDTLKMVYRSQSGHIGGSFSAADIIAALYFDVMRVRPQDPAWPGGASSPWRNWTGCGRRTPFCKEPPASKPPVWI